MALVGLLVRGAIVGLVLPIVVLPTMTGLATALGPAIIAIALGQHSADVARLAALVIGSVVLWLVGSVLLGAATDVTLIHWLAVDLEDRSTPSRVRLIEVLRVALARAVAHLPLLLVTGWGMARLVEVTRDELVMPGDLAVPLALRVARGAPEVFVLLLIAWLFGEALGELAARVVVLEGASAGRALLGAARRMAHQAAGTLGTLLLGTAGLICLVLPPIVAASIAWTGLRGVLLGDGSMAVAILGSVALSLAWIGALVLAGIAATWRSALWTAETIRSRAPLPAGDPSIASTPQVPSSAR